jgi:hypothetical protein
MVLLALGVAACGGSGTVVPKPSKVKADLAIHGIDLRAFAADPRGCVTMKPRPTNTGAVRTYGQFSLVIATRDSCNQAQMTGDADGDHIYWSRHGARWFANQQLNDNLWLRMVVSRHESGDPQHALQTATLHAFHSGN